MEQVYSYNPGARTGLLRLMYFVSNNFTFLFVTQTLRIWRKHQCSTSGSLVAWSDDSTRWRPRCSSGNWSRHCCRCSSVNSPDASFHHAPSRSPAYLRSTGRPKPMTTTGGSNRGAGDLGGRDQLCQCIRQQQQQRTTNKVYKQWKKYQRKKETNEQPVSEWVSEWVSE